ncbi:hypothetical protein [Deinococcus humi]|uniref:Uncharacterized protein n=1 Tax=Deinococcus humi TaxID=662880 RepID=A0A7W8JT29_9DEIO|nr:hypothetical protein [Deinococcus humi]MBB5361301.1 hypothetical protein [Deinococcus humi]GGO19378.1 hypothetical protein GCM10008949_03670 [Deinococcus humi]
MSEEETYRLTFKETGETQQFTGNLEYGLSKTRFTDSYLYMRGISWQRSPLFSVRRQFIREMEAGAASAESPLWRLDRLPTPTGATQEER